MRFWRSPWGAVLVVLLLAAATAIGATAFRVHRETRPPRVIDPAIDFESMMIRAESVEFQAADGVALQGWLILGRPDLPPIVLCHDVGSSKSSLINLAIALRRASFSVLLFDFRGHGASAGSGTTLGLKEKRDVLGAVEFLSTREEIDARRIGIYGVGMGAHAAVAAASDRPSLRVLVLDALYPDVPYALVRAVYRRWDFAVNHLGFLPNGIFVALHGVSPGDQRAAEIIGDLVGRDLLLLAPAGDARLASEIQRMYEAVPDQADADGNLIVLPATHGDGLYADQLSRYHERVSEFFESRLGRAEGDHGRASRGAAAPLESGPNRAGS